MKSSREPACSPGSQWAVKEATKRLIKQGLLVPQGAGRRHQIVLSEGSIEPRALRLMILLYEESDRMSGHILELVHGLQEAGHEAGFAEKTMHDLGMDVNRIARFADESDADAWVVIAGPQDVLEWFAEQRAPVFALFGRPAGIPLASTKPNKGGR